MQTLVGPTLPRPHWWKGRSEAGLGHVSRHAGSQTLPAQTSLGEEKPGQDGFPSLRTSWPWHTQPEHLLGTLKPAPQMTAPTSSLTCLLGLVIRVTFLECIFDHAPYWPWDEVHTFKIGSLPLPMTRPCEPSRVPKQSLCCRWPRACASLSLEYFRFCCCHSPIPSATTSVQLFFLPIPVLPSALGSHLLGKHHFLGAPLCSGRMCVLPSLLTIHLFIPHLHLGSNELGELGARHAGLIGSPLPHREILHTHTPIHTFI